MPWDRLELRVFGQEELSGTYEVSPRGTITVPTLGEIDVNGMRCDELEGMLTQMLKDAYLRDPSVVCINKEISKTAVTVDGQVQKPGIVEFRPGLMLTDVIKCKNPRCISSIEEECDQIFELSSNGKYRCIYCEQELQVKPE